MSNDHKKDPRRYRMRVFTWLVLSIALYGCATQQVISFDVPQTTSPLTVVDGRPDTEINYESCRNHGFGFQDGSSNAPLSTAPVHIAMAIALVAARERPGHLLMTYIDMTVAGERIAVQDNRPLTRSQVWSPVSRNQETVEIIVQSTEHAISQSIEKINERHGSGQANNA